MRTNIILRCNCNHKGFGIHFLETSLKCPSHSTTQRATCLVINFTAFPRGSWAGHEAVYLPSSNAEVQNGWSCDSTPVLLVININTGMFWNVTPSGLIRRCHHLRRSVPVVLNRLQCVKFR